MTPTEEERRTSPPEPGESPPVTPTEEERTADNEVEVQWQLSVASDGRALEVEYVVSNHGRETLLLGDQLLRFGSTPGFERAPAAMIVTPDSRDPTLVRLVRGRVQPGVLGFIEVMPATRAFEPGAELSGSARLALPLRSWHPNSGFHELRVTPTRAVLGIGVAPGTSDTSQLRLTDGQMVDVLGPVAARTTQRLVRGDEIALPTQ